MDQQRGKKPQTRTDNNPAKNPERWRNRRVIQLRIQSQQRSAKEKHQRQTQEKEDPLEISLPPVAEDHHNPKERQQSPSRQYDQPQIDGVVQMKARPAAILCPFQQHGNRQVSSFSCTFYLAINK